MIGSIKCAPTGLFHEQLANILFGFKSFSLANTLDYFKKASMTKKKSFATSVTSFLSFIHFYGHLKKG